jgi:hypothetical protein
MSVLTWQQLLCLLLPGSSCYVCYYLAAEEKSVGLCRLQAAAAVAAAAAARK